MGKQWTQWLTLFFGLQNHCRWWHCSHEIKRHLLLGRKVKTNLDSILKSRDIILPTKVHLVKAMVFPVVMYGCESWTVRKVKCWKIDAFELWCWRRLLRVPWSARRSNQSILKEISPGCSLEGLMLNSNTLATSCKELTHWKKTWCWEGLEAGGEGDDRGWDGWMASLTRWTWVWVNSGSLWWTGRPGILQFMGSQRFRHDWATELNWGLVLWSSRVLESVHPHQRLRAWSWVLRGSMYSFPLIRYSYLVLAGVLHALLCLKVYSWCIRGKTCTPGPPTPPPSCSLLLVLLILQKMSPNIYQVLNFPLLCHDHPATNLLKEEPGLYRCTLCSPKCGLPGSPAGSITGAGQLWNQHSTLPSQGTAVSQWSVPSSVGTPPHIPVPTLWHNGQPTFSSRTPSPRTTQPPVNWQILCLSNCVGQTSPTLLPAAHSALWYDTAFKQEPHHPTLNHPFQSTCIFHPSCSHTLTGHPCPYGSTKGPLREWATQVGLQTLISSARMGGMMALYSQIGTVSLGDLDPGSSGSWRSLTSLLSVSGFLLHIPSSTFCQCQDTRIPLQAGNHSHIQRQKPAWMVHGVSAIQWWSWSSSSQGALALVTQPTGKEAAQGRVCSWEPWYLQPRCRAMGYVSQEGERWWSLLKKPFIRCELGNLTIICWAPVKCLMLSRLWSKFASSKQHILNL